jgi:hypothetical protein
MEIPQGLETVKLIGMTVKKAKVIRIFFKYSGRHYA